MHTNTYTSDVYTLYPIVCTIHSIVECRLVTVSVCTNCVVRRGIETLKRSDKGGTLVPRLPHLTERAWYLFSPWHDVIGKGATIFRTTRQHFVQSCNYTFNAWCIEYFLSGYTCTFSQFSMHFFFFSAVNLWVCPFAIKVFLLPFYA